MRYAPLRAFKFETTAFSLNGQTGSDDKHETEGLQAEREAAVCGPDFVGVVCTSKANGPTDESTLESSTAGGSCVCLDGFLGGQLH